MTAQIADSVIFRGHRYAFTAVEGKGLFDPSARGISLAPVGTACWRRFVCHYQVARDRLLLRGLDVGHEGSPPTIDGVSAVKQDWVWHYDRLGIDIPFTGKLLIGRGEVALRPYLNMGFRRARLYATVWNLTFDEGKLREAKDRTAQLASVREQLGEAGAKPREGETTKDWVERTFSLGYAYSWPDVGNPPRS